MNVMLEKDAFLPCRAHKTDAGLDLRSPQNAIVPAHGSVVIDTGVHVEMPSGNRGLEAIAVEAGKAGMSYGKYVAQKEQNR